MTTPSIETTLSRVVAEIIDAWAIAKGVVYERADSRAFDEGAPLERFHRTFPHWVRLLNSSNRNPMVSNCTKPHQRQAAVSVHGCAGRRPVARNHCENGPHRNDATGPVLPA